LNEMITVSGVFCLMSEGVIQRTQVFILLEKLAILKVFPPRLAPVYMQRELLGCGTAGQWAAGSGTRNAPGCCSLVR
jgi:hypothetical protein